jgi:hypothetical protein
MTLRTLPDFEKSLADGQGDGVRRIVAEVVAIFRKRLAERRSALNRRYGAVG